MKPQFAKELSSHSTLAKLNDANAFPNWLNRTLIRMCLFRKFGDSKRNWMQKVLKWNRGATSGENSPEHECTLAKLIAALTKLAGKTYTYSIATCHNEHYIFSSFWSHPLSIMLSRHSCLAHAFFRFLLLRTTLKWQIGVIYSKIQDSNKVLFMTCQKVQRLKMQVYIKHTII